MCVLQIDFFGRGLSGSIEFKLHIRNLVLGIFNYDYPQCYYQ
jgi:hypothetical protein